MLSASDIRGMMAMMPAFATDAAADLAKQEQDLHDSLAAKQAEWLSVRQSAIATANDMVLRNAPNLLPLYDSR
jgi:hypothetical protein